MWNPERIEIQNLFAHKYTCLLYTSDSLGATLSKAEFDTMESNIKLLEKELQKGVAVENMGFKNEKMMSFAKEAKKFAKYIMSEM